ncbi:hypothetical protein G9P44_005523 [Scheffersomyces stipitis]|nr:hypothetical protein G9P44_005523 [Scheffersomyces stipitis]
MSHPAASIKSIFSGRVNLDTPEGMDPFEYNSSYNTNDNSFVDDDDNDMNGSNGSAGESNNFNSANSKDEDFNGPTLSDGDEIKFNPDDVDDMSSRYSHDSNYSITSKNLRTLSESFTQQQPNTNKEYLSATDANNKGRQFSDTNLSLASTASDYQQNYTDDPSETLSTPPPDYLQADPFSRPISRNSTTSCLSTTATKDGIEGKRFHRHGPTTYSSNIIANMIHSQQIQQMKEKQLQQQREKNGHIQSNNKNEENEDAENLENENKDNDIDLDNDMENDDHEEDQTTPILQVSSSSFSNNNSPTSPSISITASPPSVYKKANTETSFTSQTPSQSVVNDASVPDPDYSEYSARTTNAQFDGEGGLGGERNEQYFEKRLPPNYHMPPPITLKEKINLLNTDSISDRK